MAHTKDKGKKTDWKDEAEADWEKRSFVADKRTHREHAIENTQGTHNEHTENTQRTHWEKRRETELETFSIRLHPDDKRRLAAYFDRRATALSQGIRQILADFMDRNDI